MVEVVAIATPAGFSERATTDRTPSSLGFG